MPNNLDSAIAAMRRGFRVLSKRDPALSGHVMVGKDSRGLASIARAIVWWDGRQAASIVKLSDLAHEENPRSDGTGGTRRR